MFYSEDIIEQVRSENNIVDVIGDYVKLQKKGSSYFGLCPFHNEKSLGQQQTDEPEKEGFLSVLRNNA